MAEAQAGPSLTLPRTLRVYEKVPVAPVWIGLGFAAALIALYVVSCFLFGDFSKLVDGTAPDHIYRDLRTALVSMAGLAFLPTARIYLARTTHRNLNAVWPSLGPEGRRIAIEGGGSGERSLPALLAPPVGACLMWLFLLASLIQSPAVITSGDYWIPEHAWHWALLGPLGWMMGTMARAMIEDSRLFLRLAREIPEIDLLDHAAFAPFVRQGLVGALIWILFLSASSSLLIDLDLTGPFGVMVPAVLAIAITALLIPVWGARCRIREVKREQLARLRAEIRESERALDSHPTDAANASRLRALLAYESRIERVREWPFDASTLVRFLFYVALGVGSWLGAALVERSVDSLLG